MGGRGSSSGRGAKGGGKSLAQLNEMVQSNPENALSQLTEILKTGTFDKPKFTANGNSISQQGVTIKSGNDELQVYFSSGYNPQQVTTPNKPIKNGIYATTWHNGNATSFRVLAEAKTKSLKNAKKNYDAMLDTWKKATGQKKITL